MDTNPENSRAGIVILGKARGRKRESLQLFARTALAGLLWHITPQPRPYILIVTRDSPEKQPDAVRVAARLQGEYDIPGHAILARTWSNCTLLETRAVRVLARAHQLAKFRVLTHPYHRPRAQVLFDEVLPRVEVLPTQPSLVADLLRQSPPLPGALTRDLRGIDASMPIGLDLLREHAVERILTLLHRFDERGVLERRLADRIRPDVCR